MFEKHEVTRPAAPEEKADIMQRLLDVLNDIDSVKGEAKNVAKTYKEQLDGLEFRKLGLRLNLENGTVTQEVEVHAVANEATGIMQYFNREGVEVTELSHPMSEKQKEQEALQRQLDMFGQEPGKATIDKDAFAGLDDADDTDLPFGPTDSDEQPGEKPPHLTDEEYDLVRRLTPLPAGADLEQARRDMFNTSPSGSAIGDMADLVAVLGMKNPDDEQPVTVASVDNIDNAAPQTEPATAADMTPARRNGRFVKRETPPTA